MKDFLGQEVHIGDKVAYYHTLNNNMIKATVIGFTKQMIKVNHNSEKNYSLVRSSCCIVYERAANDIVFPPTPELEFITETFSKLICK